MRARFIVGAVSGVTVLAVTLVAQTGQATQTGQAQTQTVQEAPDDVRTLVTRLELEKFKATLKGLTQFGDRREATQRNRDAVDWIETQLKSFGCPTGRLTYEPPAPRGGGGGGGRGQTLGPLPAPVRSSGTNNGGATLYGNRGRTGVNNNAEAQPDEKLRALNAGPVIPGPIPVVFCTKVGTTRPNEMYIIGAHMDGIGWGEAANDDGSGTALVMEMARVFSSPDVTTDVSIRFALWNGEEGGLRGARAYVAQREKLQGQEDPPGSGRYPEPKWLGMIQHDMMMFDHGMPRDDGTLNPEQRPEADFNIEFQSNSKMADAAMKLALAVKLAADKYTTDYPGTLGPHMTNTDSGPFMDIVAAISLRENERGMNTGAGWNPHWHQPTDLFKTFSDKDFKLGVNAGQATLSAIAQLTGAKIKK
ncbi:MAG TPA: M28 family peptidase [Vicinamibacterales bacterium]|nr:M28 family peptidase [Vicinamibacterales bacterium]